MGRKQPRSVVQIDELDSETRVALWNIYHTLREQLAHDRNYEAETAWMRQLWIHEFKQPLDEMPPESTLWRMIKNRVMDDDAFEVLDFIEESCKHFLKAPRFTLTSLHAEFVNVLNVQFETYLVGYRFVDGIIVQIDSPAEVEAVESAIEGTDSVPGARESLRQALDLLADRQSPDYATSIARSIGAVEAVVKKITSKGVLSEGLKVIRDKGLPLHPALVSGWTKMYGWTSDEEGLRHPGIEAAKVDQDLAKYMLITCSAFVSYLLSSAIAEGIIDGN